VKALVLALGLASVFAFSNAQAQPYPSGSSICNLDRKLVIHNLKEKYGETLKGRGVSKNGAVLYEFFLNEETQTFTQLMTFSVNNTTCMSGSGQFWETIVKEELNEPT